MSTKVRKVSRFIGQVVATQLNALREYLLQGGITDSTGGTPGTSLADVTGEHSQSILNNNFATLAAKLNTLIGKPHATITSVPDDAEPPTVTALQVTAAAPTSEATRVALANDIKRVLNAHFADSVAHKSDVSDPIETDDAVMGDSLASAIELANDCKAAFNTHRSESNVHFTNDAGNAIGASDASNSGTLDTLLAELKTDINAHIVASLGGLHVEAIDS
jgi:hypothetical protein